MMDYNRGRKWKENAILYRMNAQSNALEYAFKRNGVPYQVVGGTKFFERAEVKDMLAYLAVINNPSDDLRLRRIINNPPRGIGNTTIERVQDLASEQGVPMMAVLQHAGEYAVLKSAAGKLERFAQLIALREMADTMELAEFYDAVCEQTSYVRTLQEKGDMESRGRLENVQELKSNIVSFLENDPEDATLSGFLNEIALYTDLDSATSDNCVTMMTMHSAKGLEFPCVYVVGVEEGIFPGERVRYNDEEVEEERRLCYVAMTRAKERLTMTCTRQRMLFGRTSVSEPSRFLEEVPSENANWSAVRRRARPALATRALTREARILRAATVATVRARRATTASCSADQNRRRRKNSRRRSPPPPRRCFSSPPATRSTTRRSVTDWSSPSPLWAAMRCLRWRLIRSALKS